MNEINWKMLFVQTAIHMAEQMASDRFFNADKAISEAKTLILKLKHEFENGEI